MNNVSKKTTNMVQLALFSAIIVLLAMVPGLGYIPLGVIKATTIHIPVIIGAILMGPKQGAFLGFVFGCTSLINGTINPTITSFVFSPFYSMGEIHGGPQSLIVCFIPRILIGVVAYYVFAGMRKLFGKLKVGTTVSLAVAGIAGSMTNTLLVMNLIYFLFGQTYAQVIGKSFDTLYAVILGVIGTNGVPEAIVAGVLTTAVCSVFFRSKLLSSETATADNTQKKSMVSSSN
ncbi:MAG: ECF transporter S component [Lachnospiraceae bacterium]|nr:ECF transporter S component [Lachnospiraceae bacterium]